MKTGLFLVWCYGSSMLPTLTQGPQLFDPAGRIERGAIVLIRNGAGSDTLKIKRVVGIPGDTLVALSDVICAGGECDALYGDELKRPGPPARVMLDMPQKGRRGRVIPSGYVYLLSDNLSTPPVWDSRGKGLLPVTSIRGILHSPRVSQK